MGPYLFKLKNAKKVLFNTFKINVFLTFTNYNLFIACGFP